MPLTDNNNNDAGLIRYGFIPPNKIGNTHMEELERKHHDLYDLQRIVWDKDECKIMATYNFVWWGTYTMLIVDDRNKGGTRKHHMVNFMLSPMGKGHTASTPFWAFDKEFINSTRFYAELMRVLLLRYEDCDPPDRPDWYECIEKYHNSLIQTLDKPTTAKETGIYTLIARTTVQLQESVCGGEHGEYALTVDDMGRTEFRFTTGRSFRKKFDAELYNCLISTSNGQYVVRHRLYENALIDGKIKDNNMVENSDWEMLNSLSLFQPTLVEEETLKGNDKAAYISPFYLPPSHIFKYDTSSIDSSMTGFRMLDNNMNENIDEL